MRSQSTHPSAVGAHGGSRAVRAVVELQEVVLAVSGVVDAELGEGDGDHSAPGSPDVPLAVRPVGIGSRVVGAGHRAVVSVQSAAATCPDTDQVGVTQVLIGLLIWSMAFTPPSFLF